MMMPSSQRRHPKQNVGHNSPGRRAKIPPISDYEARERAKQILGAGGPPAGARHAIALLAEGGIMTEAQLRAITGLSDDTLGRYCRRYLLARLEAPPTLQALLPDARKELYLLGKVGLVLAERGGRTVPKGYELDLPVDRITHDVLCNAVFDRLSWAAKVVGWDAQLRGRYTATVCDQQGTPELEPDAHLLLRHPNGETRHFLVEYHHEDWGTRAMQKIQGYEHLLERKDERPWRQAWKIEPAPAGERSVLPRVLVVWTHAAVSAGYARAVREQAEAEDGLWTLYLGKSLAELLDPDSDPLQWHCFNWERPHHLLDQQ